MESKPRRAVSAIKYRSKAAAVYDELRHQILRGDLAPGSTINQENLAATLGVSTTPLREALRRLETEGLVHVAAYRDVIVAPLDLEEFVALYTVRVPLEGLGARLAASSRTDDDVAEASAAMTALRAGNGDYITLNRRFHRAIYMASHNPVLIELLDSVWDRCDRYRRLTPSFLRDPAVIEEHQVLLDTVVSGDPDRAELAMLEHTRKAKETIEREVRSGLRHDGASAAGDGPVHSLQPAAADQEA
jgi:DNA-binding GntR family transcriptional regulator